MAKAVIGKEIVIDAANRSGLLSDICALFIRGSLRIDGIVGVATGRDAKIMIVTGDINRAEFLLQGTEFIPIKETTEEKRKQTMWDDDISRALDMLKSGGFKFVQENDVIIVELDESGDRLKRIVDLLAANKLDIGHIYTTASYYKCPTRLILTCDNNKKALKLLNENL